MNCIIIEDEHAAANYLEHLLKETGSNMEVLIRLNSVKKAVGWLKSNQTDLIFLDVQLSDGLGFEIFDHVQINTPVVFTTSYDKYAIKAFELNSLSYLLKPVNEKHLLSAIEKYYQLYTTNATIKLPEHVNILPAGYQKRFLVEQGNNNYHAVAVEDTAYLRIQDGRHLILTCKDGTQHIIENSLEKLEQRLDPAFFFRVNRQFIVNIKAIANMTGADRGRIKIKTNPESKEEIIVAITKVAAFKEWLNS